MTRRSGCSNGSGRSSAAYTALNIVVVAAMPSASVATAMIATPRIRARLRTLYRRSVIATRTRGAQCPLTRRLQNALPAFAVFRPPDEGGRFGRVGRAHVLVVPLDLLPRPVGDVSEMVRFSPAFRILDVGAPHGADSLRVVHPLPPVTWRSRQRLRRCLEVRQLLLGQQLSVPEQHALFAEDRKSTRL